VTSTADRTRVVVLAPSDEPPPGIDAAGELADLRFAPEIAALRGAIADAEVVFAWRSNVGGPLLPRAWDRAGRLVWIQAPSDGVEGLLFPELVESDVVLTNARGIFDRAVAEHALALLLAMAKHLAEHVRDTTERAWRQGDLELLAGTKLLVVGAGPIGRAIGRLATAFEMQVRGIGRTPRPDDDLDEIVSVDGLPQQLGWADVVVNILPATPSTLRLFDASAFAAMRPSARFVNVGRGSTVDELAMIEALRRGAIAGVALDVFEEEPLPADSPLWELPNVIITPHVAGDFAGWREVVVRRFIENLKRFRAGEPLLGIVDKRLGFPAGEGAAR
jgi:phosphoglycerate dehydrogenase-like enzyme